MSNRPHVVIINAFSAARRRLTRRYNRRCDLRHSTYVNPTKVGADGLRRCLDCPHVDLLLPHAGQIASTTEQYIAHRFDLLGSGWVQVHHGMRCRGLEGHRYDAGSSVTVDGAGRWLEGRINPANLEEAQRIWRMVDGDYSPIDWHLDFKSGYRWSERVWYQDVRYGHQQGVDIKVPWELARMQHLPQLAFAYALAKDGRAGLAQPQTYLREFRNQVIDFIATNPPRFGVNWAFAIEPAIRVANWLIAFDLFKSCGADFDESFKVEFAKSVYSHGLHIASNLEWHPWLRGNHYLANIVGLLFVAAYLPRAPLIDAWLAFTIQDLVREVRYQFNRDGTYSEASTSYHAFSAEMVVYATALVSGLPSEKQQALSTYNHRLLKGRPGLQPAPITLYHLPNSDRQVPFPDWYLQRLERMAEFVVHITKQNRHIPQVGDNDSGRFLKIQPVFQHMTVGQAKSRYLNLDGYTGLPDEFSYWDEDHLNRDHLAAAASGMFRQNDLVEDAGGDSLDKTLIQSLSRRALFCSYRKSGEPTAAEGVVVGKEEQWMRLLSELDSLLEGCRQVWKNVMLGSGFRLGLRTYAYPDFGLYLFRSSRVYLAIRCGAAVESNRGGHAHNDQLSIELSIDGNDLITDPGTYLYTPLPQRRNEYRSVKAHCAPQLQGREPGRLNLGLFRLRDEARAECLYFGEAGFAGVHWGYGEPVHLVVEVRDDGIYFSTYLRADSSSTILSSWDSDSHKSTLLSTGYGVIGREDST